MNTLTLNIANALTISETLIKEVREWAYVYWVGFVKGRPTLISKKKIMNSKTDDAVSIISNNLGWDEDGRLVLGEKTIPSRKCPWDSECGLLVREADDELYSLDELLEEADGETELSQAEINEVEEECLKKLTRTLQHNSAVEEFYRTHHIEVVEFSGDSGYSRSSGESYTQERYVHNVSGDISYKVGQEPTKWEHPVLESHLRDARRSKFRANLSRGLKTLWIEQNLAELTKIAQSEGLI